MSRTAIIVWNADHSEGAVFIDGRDADQCMAGRFSSVASALGQYFSDLYDEDEREIEPIEVEDAP